MSKGLTPFPNGPRLSRQVLLTTGGGFATAVLFQGCGGGGTTTQALPPVPIAPDTASTKFPLLASPATYPLPPVGAFRGTMTVPGLTAPAGAALTIVDSLKAPSGAPIFQNRSRIPQSGSLSVLFFIQMTASVTVTLPSLPQLSIVVPTSFITPGAQFFYAISDPTATNVALQFRTEGPASVSGSTLTFTASSNPLQLTAGLQYIIAVYSVTQSTQSIEDQLAAVLSSPDAVSLRKLIAGFVTDPAVAALATNVLQSDGDSLSNAQRNLLTSISIATRDPATLSALISGTPLTEAQQRSRDSLLKDLENNAAIQLLLATANQLKQQASTLASEVSQDVTSLAIRLRQPPPVSQDPTLDAVLEHLVNIHESTSFRNVAAAMAPLMQSSDFIPFLQKQPPQVVAGFIPVAVQNALNLTATGRSLEFSFRHFLKAVGEILGGSRPSQSWLSQMVLPW